MRNVKNKSRPEKFDMELLYFAVKTTKVNVFWTRPESENIKVDVKAPYCLWVSSLYSMNFEENQQFWREMKISKLGNNVPVS